MSDTYKLANSNCGSCGKGKELSQNIYKGNYFNIPDNFVTDGSSLGATKFFGYSIAEYGDLVYKNSGNKINVQKILFPSKDTVYLNRKDDMWVLGI